MLRVLGCGDRLAGFQNLLPHLGEIHNVESYHIKHTYLQGIDAFLLFGSGPIFGGWGTTGLENLGFLLPIAQHP